MDDKSNNAEKLLYEIASKIARFCDEVDNSRKGSENEADKRGLEI